jgi:acyl-homoserine lactone synthase
MIEAITRENAHLYGPELDEMFRLRHRMFVEHLGWEALRKPDGIEKDQFDTEDAIYLLLMDDGVVVGCHRLIPTMKPHLFSELFPHLCDVKGLLRDPHVYELNRTCVDLVRLPPDAARWARQANMLGLMEFCIRFGIERLSVLTAPHYISHYLRIGWKILPLGVPTEIEGETQVAVEIHCNTEGLEAMRQAYGMHEPLVRCVGIHMPTPTPIWTPTSQERSSDAVLH